LSVVAVCAAASFVCFAVVVVVAVACVVPHSMQFMLHVPSLHRYVPVGHGVFIPHWYSQFAVHPRFLPLLFPRSHSSPKSGCPSPHCIVSLKQSGSTFVHTSSHSPFACMLQHAPAGVISMLHSSPVVHLSCLLLQSEHAHPSFVSQLLL